MTSKGSCVEATGFQFAMIPLRGLEQSVISSFSLLPITTRNFCISSPSGTDWWGAAPTCSLRGQQLVSEEESVCSANSSFSVQRGCLLPHLSASAKCPCIPTTPRGLGLGQGPQGSEMGMGMGSWGGACPLFSLEALTQFFPGPCHCGGLGYKSPVGGCW